MAASASSPDEDGFRERAEEAGEQVIHQVKNAFDYGRHKGETMVVGEEEARENTKERMGRRGQVQGLTVILTGAVILGLTAIVLLLMELISGKFASAIPAGGAFTGAANNTTKNVGTSYNIMGVATLVIPVVVVVGLLVGVLGAFFFGGGGMGGSGGRL